MLQNVAYRPTVYKIEVGSSKKKETLMFQEGLTLMLQG